MGPARERPRRRTLVLDLPPAKGQSASWAVRTRYVRKPRDGILRVFMPPQRYLEDYLALVAAVEDTAAELGIPCSSKATRPARFSHPHDQSHARSRRD
jgi:uncharacterized protein (DUF2126 family)